MLTVRRLADIAQSIHLFFAPANHYNLTLEDENQPSEINSTPWIVMLSADVHNPS